jgi:hypothetical protein
VHEWWCVGGGVDVDVDGLWDDLKWIHVFDDETKATFMSVGWWCAQNQ